MWLENDATMTRPGAFLMMCRSWGPTADSEGVNPGLVALVESERRRSIPWVAKRLMAW